MCTKTKKIQKTADVRFNVHKQYCGFQAQHLQNTEIYNANFNVHKKNIENTENCNARFNVHKNIVVSKPYTFSTTTKCTLHKKM